ncbi:MAG: carboxypeptidase-like regulatory domain-containing protein, partial [Acidobacteriota bacterium]|nr:carboxypeptidase-like regulatory domain-containing protein [Acidobacteriota bacterium]
MEMLNRLALALAIAFLAEPALAQPPSRTVSGTVVDADSRAPIPNARLSLNQLLATTDAAGRFSLSVAAGQIALLVEAAGYFPLAADLDVPESGLAEVELAL